jgi:hypothetical protein
MAKVPTEKFEQKRAALQKQLAALDEKERAFHAKMQREGSERLAAAISRVSVGACSKGEATKLSKRIEKLGVVAAIERLS